MPSLARLGYNGMTKRIETFSKVEHEIIREVHPQVNEIKEQAVLPGK